MTLRPLRDRRVDTPTILSVLQPRRHGKTVSLSRLRERNEAVLDAAVAAGYGPAGSRSWDILKHLLGKPAKVKHYAAMDWHAVPVFVADLRRREGSAARALEFVTLTAPRTGLAPGDQRSTWTPSCGPSQASA
jgi:hypothetical protein